MGYIWGDFYVPNLGNLYPWLNLLERKPEIHLLFIKNNMEQVLIAGASGFIGKYISQKFIADGWQVRTIGRSGPLRWDDEPGITAALDQSKVLINLAGRSVNCRHNERNKKAILESRVRTTETLNKALRNCVSPPQLWINASGNAIYPRSFDKAYNEHDMAVDDTFMHDVCVQWEAALFANEIPATRRIAFRTGVVLGEHGGILQQLSRLVKAGLGGTVGSGRQMMSWIHIEDYYRVIRFLIERTAVEGAVNLCAPRSECNKYFMQQLRRSLKMPFGLPAPEFAVKIAAPIMGTDASLALDSYNTVSAVLPAAGFDFSFPDLALALDDLKDR